jgi:hypothetical protein
LSPETLIRKVNNFAIDVQWPERDIVLLRWAAILGQNPVAFQYEIDENGQPVQLDDRGLRTAVIERINNLIQQNGETYGELRPLDNDEIDNLVDERNHRWRQPGKLYFTIVLVCSQCTHALETGPVLNFQIASVFENFS